MNNVNENYVGLTTLKKFKPLMVDEKNSEKRNVLLISGRVGGKTTAMIQKIFLNFCNYPNKDIQILRANSSSLKESVFTTFKKFCFNNLPDSVFSKFKWRSTPPLLITSAWGNQIHFSGVGLGSKSGSNTSRGKDTLRKLSLIVVEETQEIFSGLTGNEDLLNHALASYLRFLDDEIGKIVYAGNRDRNVNGKFNVWAKNKEKDPSFTIIESSWLNIRKYLNRATIQSILIEKELNPKNYEYMYLGIPVGGNDLAYGAFIPSLHVINPLEINRGHPRFFNVNYNNGKVVEDSVYRLFIGVDGANSRDTCAFMPIFNTQSNRLILKTGDILSHNPKKNGIIRNNILVKDYVKKWFDNLLLKYALYELTRENIYFVVDGHNIDLIENLVHFLGHEAIVIKFTRKDLVETTEKVNNALTDKSLFFTEESWIPIMESKETPMPPSVLFNEIETVCWDETRPDKFNESIPNDFTDGIRYPVALYATPSHLWRSEN